MRELAQVLTEEVFHLDWESVDRLAEACDSARHVLLFGAGRSGSLALAFGQRLAHIGLAVARIGDAGNTRLGPEDAVVVVSGSGATASTVVVAQQASDVNCGHICLVTTEPSSPIARLADVVVVLHARSKGSSEIETLAPYTAQFDLCVLALSESVARLIMARRNIADADIEQWRPNVE